MVEIGNHHRRVRHLKEFGVVLEFSSEVDVKWTAMELYEIKVWCGQFLEVNGHLRRIIDLKVHSQAELNIEDADSINGCSC